MKKTFKEIKPKKVKPLFKAYRACIKAGSKKVTYHYVGKHFEKGSLILCNHESTKGPLAWDFFCDVPVRLLGTEEMNSGLRRMYKYQSETYYHEKKHWNLFLSKIYCLLASPMTNWFYKGLSLISIREGFQFKKTITDVYTSLHDFKESIVIFPEDSTRGYLEQLDGFKEGFLLICEYCYKKGYDIPLVVAYYRKKDSVMIVDEPIMYSTLKERHLSRKEMAETLKDRCNELGRSVVPFDK